MNKLEVHPSHKMKFKHRPDDFFLNTVFMPDLKEVIKTINLSFRKKSFSPLVYLSLLGFFLLAHQKSIVLICRYKCVFEELSTG